MSLAVTLEKRLGTFRIAATFRSEAGVTALFGRSGAGKTSIVNMIAGLLTPDRGSIEVNGERLFDSDRTIDILTRRRRIGYVFQDARLFPHMSVHQNLLYGRRFTRVQNPCVEFDHVVDLLAIATLLERRPGALSGGEKQRVAIGRALLANPRLLLMDEPLASLDGPRRAEILPYIERLRDEFGLPIVYVSHTFEEIARLANTLVLIDRGTVAAAGAPEDLMSRLDLYPLTGRYEAGAVLDTVVEQHDTEFDLSTLRFAGGTLLVPRIAHARGTSLRVRVRARDVSLALGPLTGVSIRNQLPGRVVEVSVEPGPYAEVRLDLNGTALLARVTRLTVHELGLQPGRPVYALIKSIAIDRHSLGMTTASANSQSP